MAKINVAELDFSTIKSLLKDFLRDQDEFADFDFEGSAMNILMDMLAYNTHFMGFYANMLYNESFLDSAVKRSSVVSLAKHLNYTPKSITASQATVDLLITPEDTPLDITIPKYTQFSTNIDSENFTFINLVEYVAEPTGVGNAYEAEDVALVQGTRRTLAFTVDSGNPDQKFVLPFANIDTNLLTVTVQTSAEEDEQVLFTLMNSIVDVEPTDPVYYLQETEGGRFELKFGDDIIGKAVEDGNIIIIDYILTDGETANGANVFTPVNTVGGYSAVNVTTVQAAVGGADAESVEAIKLLAPRFFESQKRAVTQQDYEAILLDNVTLIQQNFDSVAVWGGEDNDPPKYGNVFMSFKPKEGVLITNFLKQQITEELIENLNIIGIIPEIVDPEYLYLEITCDVNFAQNRTTKGRNDIKTLVVNAIKDYRDDTLAFFDRNFRYSDLTVLIENCDVSIENNLMTLKMKREIELTLNTAAAYTLKFYNAIEPGTLTTNEFWMAELDNATTDRYYWQDDREGNITLWKQRADGIEILVDSAFGTIDYTEGTIEIPTFTPQSLFDDADQFFVTVTPAINNIDSVRNMILTYENADIDVTANAIIV